MLTLARDEKLARVRLPGHTVHQQTLNPGIMGKGPSWLVLYILRTSEPYLSCLLSYGSLPKADSLASYEHEIRSTCSCTSMDIREDGGMRGPLRNKVLVAPRAQRRDHQGG